jgi:hypothetical protein
MSRLIFMLEEPSMQILLEILLPRLFPDLPFVCIPHEGKTDLERSLPRKLRAWRQPDDLFVVMRDNDGGDCKALKSALAAMCAAAGRGDTLVRIVCQELEAWYFGEPIAMANAFGMPQLGNIGQRAGFRDPDAISRPSRALAALHGPFQKIDGARKMAHHLTYGRNRSRSFRAMVEGIAKITGCSLPAQEV